MLKKRRMVDKEVTVRSTPWGFGEALLGLRQLAYNFDNRNKWRRLYDQTAVTCKYRKVTLTEVVADLKLHVTEEAYEKIEDYLMIS